MICIHIIYQFSLGLNIATYSTTIFINQGIDPFLARISTLIVGFIGIDGTIIFRGISDYFGRKKIL